MFCLCNLSAAIQLELENLSAKITWMGPQPCLFQLHQKQIGGVHVFPGPTILSTLFIVSVPNAKLAIACAPPIL